MLDFWNIGKLTRISPGVLSRLVRLEELHVVGVEDCGYSTLRELESLSRLTALTLHKCSLDLIYSNFGLSSKLTRNSEFVSSSGKGSKNVVVELQNVKDLRLADCDSLDIHCRNNILFTKLERLEVSCPNLEVLCICAANSISALCYHQLPTAYFSKLVTLEVRDCGILRNLMPPSVARGLLNLRTLLIEDCQSMEEVITEEEQRGGEIVCNEPLFPPLEKLELDNLRKLGHFILMKGALEFPFLIEVMILKCPEMGTVSTLNLESVSDDDELKVVDLNKAIFNSKISCPSLEKLSVNAANNITALCSHQLPTAYFSKLKELTVNRCGKLRNLMSPSVARGLLNIRELRIKDCPVMEEMITEKEQEGEEIMTNETVFPRLEKLNLGNLPKLGHFILTNGALEFPFLIEVNILNCPKMKTFIHQGTVSTLNLGSVNNDDVLKVVDLNKA
ncbi:putative disease resistance protein-like, partial [Capsicum annuum]